MSEQKNRHNIQKTFYLSNVIGLGGAVVNTANWTDQTPEGLSKFIQKNVPDWQQLMVVKTTTVIDPQKKLGNKTVSQKQSYLKIGRLGTGSLCISVDKDLTQNGVIPQHIRKFFGENQK